uniref:Semaphorin-3D n=1 Tax=Pelusios castaneus TaxID=367368 RepID=A0A8C8RPK0_9SAUR
MVPAGCPDLGACCSLTGSSRPGLPEATWATDLLRSNSSRLLLDSGEGLAFQSILVDEARAWLMVGAKNHIFLLHLDSPAKEPQKVFWPAPPEQVERCRLAGKSAECANFIRLLQQFNRSHVFACGTGSYQPICAFVQLGARAELVAHSVESGRGKCPYSPHEPFTGLLLDGKLYSGTSSDFMGSRAAFFRTQVHSADQNYIRTEQNQGHWLNEPVFIGAYAIPDTYNADDDKVYVFLRETAVEAGQWERRRIHARVARVCKNDVGGKRSLINRWSTFLKARLVCSIPEPQAGETHFDQLEDVFLLHNRDPRSPLLFGLFTVASGIFNGSAVCVYSMAAVRAAFNGAFAHKEGPDYGWVEYKGRTPYPRPGTCPSETYDPLLHSTKDFSDDVIRFMRSHQLMWGSVYPLGRKPILVRVNVPYRLRQLLVDRVETAAGHYDLLFLGTDEGKVLKVGLANGRGQDSEEISLEEILFPFHTQQELFVSSTHGLVQLSLHRCELYGQDCADCCLARDPYCTWDGKGCTPPTSVLPGQSPRPCCRPSSPPWTAAAEKLVFGVENNTTFLECLAHSPQTAVQWFLQRSREAALHEEVAPPSPIHTSERGLLIRQLAREDAGVYQCQAVERAFSRPLVRYRLRVIGHGAIEAAPRKRSKDIKEGGSPLSLAPIADLQVLSKGYPQAPGAPGSSLDAYCHALQHQERLRQAAWPQTWQHQHPLESRNGRVRRQPDPVQPPTTELRLV